MFHCEIFLCDLQARQNVNGSNQRHFTLKYLIKSYSKKVFVHHKPDSELSFVFSVVKRIR